VSEEWICTECEYPYYEPPAECQMCGNEVVVPRDEYDGGGLEAAMNRVRSWLLAPMSVDRNLLGGGRFVRAAFLVIVTLAAAVALLLVVGVLLG
jgi:hypothetical protein